MKKTITPEQFYELSVKARKKYKLFFKKGDVMEASDTWYGWIQIGHEFFTDDKNKMPVYLMSIGQMIEFLVGKETKSNLTAENSLLARVIGSHYQPRTSWDEFDEKDEEDFYDVDSLCDDLWKAVKGVLEK